MKRILAITGKIFLTIISSIILWGMCMGLAYLGFGGYMAEKWSRCPEMCFFFALAISIRGIWFSDNFEEK